MELAAFADFLVGGFPSWSRSGERTAKRCGPPASSPTTRPPVERAHDRDEPAGRAGHRCPRRVQVVRRPRVLDNVSLTAEEGTIFSLLGPNGAGKTTMVRILSTLVPADSGSMRVAGHDVGTDPDAVRSADRGDGPVLGRGQPAHRDREPSVDGRSPPSRPRDRAPTGERAAGAVRPRRCRRQAAVDLLGGHAPAARPGDDAGRPTERDLPRRTNDRPGPTQSPHHVGIIRALASDGVTILLTTQYLDEADQLSDRIAVLDRGRIVAEGTPAELKARIPGGHVRLHFADPRQLRSASDLLPVAVADQDQLALQAPADGSADSLRDPAQ